jgi:hypothetical protein
MQRTSKAAVVVTGSNYEYLHTHVHNEHDTLNGAPLMLSHSQRSATSRLNTVRDPSVLPSNWLLSGLAGPSQSEMYGTCHKSKPSL